MARERASAGPNTDEPFGKSKYGSLYRPKSGKSAVPAQLAGSPAADLKALPSSGKAGTASTAVVFANDTASSPVATTVALDPWQSQEGLIGDFRLELASTAASKTFKIDDSLGKPLHSGGAKCGTPGACRKAVRGAGTGADPPESATSSSDDN